MTLDRFYPIPSMTPFGPVAEEQFVAGDPFEAIQNRLPGDESVHNLKPYWLPWLPPSKSPLQRRPNLRLHSGHPFNRQRTGNLEPILF